MASWPVAVVLVLGLTGCSAFGVRPSVATEDARALLTTAVGLAVSGELDQLCELAPEDASTCRDSIVDFGHAVPGEGPRVACVVAAPDVGPLRNGRVVVVEGIDADGVEYVTEFVAYNDGTGEVVLDPVWWSGLTIGSYTETAVTWRFDSSSTTCDRGGIEVEADTDQ